MRRYKLNSNLPAPVSSFGVGAFLLREGLPIVLGKISLKLGKIERSLRYYFWDICRFVVIRALLQLQNYKVVLGVTFFNRQMVVVATLHKWDG